MDIKYSYAEVNNLARAICGMGSPELPTQEEEKKISEMIETDIDHAIEQEHIREIVPEQPLDIDEGY
jgi:hypothetical protein